MTLILALYTRQSIFCYDNDSGLQGPFIVTCGSLDIVGYLVGEDVYGI